jgi:hypothetical protein
VSKDGVDSVGQDVDNLIRRFAFAVKWGTEAVSCDGVRVGVRRGLKMLGYYTSTVFTYAADVGTWQRIFDKLIPT